MKNNIRFIVNLFRMKQWVKNTFVFFPLIFSGNLRNTAEVISCLKTFAAFCLVASSVYILNDLMDIKRDRLHPKKKNRPLAKANVNPFIVLIGILILQASGLLLFQQIDMAILFIGIIYILVNVTYNLGTKHVVILDVIFVAFGYHLRIWAGSVAAGVLPSVWLQMCVFLLALFLGFTKRRYEISTLKNKASEHRSVLAHYTSYLLDQIIIICSTLAIVFYGLYTISPDIVERIGSYNMAYSVTFVIYGIFRYLYLVHVKSLGEEPGEILLADKPLLICVLLWIIYLVSIIY